MDTIATMFSQPPTAYGIGMAFSLLGTFLVSCIYLRRTGHRADSALRLAVIGIPLVWLCSRLVFVLASLTYYTVTLSNLSLALRFWDGGYSLVGAVIGLVIAAVIAGRWTGAPMLDAVGFAAPAGILLARLYEADTGLGLGRPITYEWLMFLGIDDGMGDIVYPVYLMEAAAALIVYLAVSLWLARRRKPLRRGDVCLVSMTLLAAFQIVLESMRNDGHMVVHFVRIQMVLCLVVLLIALVIFSRRLVKLGGMKKSHQLLLWLVTIVCIGVAVLMEFRVDRGSLKILYYAVMSLCVAVITWMALHCRAKADKLA